MVKTLGIGAILLSFSGFLSAAGTVAPCNPASADFCELQRPEAISFIPGTDWMVVNTSSPDAPLVFINVRSKQRVPITLPLTAPKKQPSHKYGAVSAPNCPGPPTQLHTGSNDIKLVGTEIRLVTINHPEYGKAVPPADEGGRVELLSIDLPNGIPAVHWLGCFPVPQPYSLNDVAIAPDGAIYASYQYPRTHSPAEHEAMRQKWLSRLPTGYAIEWKPGAGWTKVPNTDVSFANGVAVSRDGRLFAVAGTYSYEVVLIDRHTGAVQRVPVPLTPDNVNTLADGGFVTVGHTGVPVTGIDPCRGPKSAPCSFPFAVALIDQQGHVRVIYAHNGTSIPGASSAALHEGKLYFGTVFANRVSVVDAPAGAPSE